jgi:hypothetical protein
MAVSLNTQVNLSTGQFSDEPVLPWKEDRYTLSDEASWDVYDSGGLLVRYFKFLPLTPQAFFSKITISGYVDGKITIQAKYLEKNKEKAEAFFKNNSPFPLFSEFPLICSTFIKSPEARMWFFSRIKKNIEANDSILDLCEKLVSAIDWKKVTPPTNSENNILQNLRYFRLSYDTISPCGCIYYW